MNPSKADSESLASPWGPSKAVSLDDLWVVASEVYCGSPVWRQVPLTLDPDGVIPQDFSSEVSAVTKEVMASLAAELKKEANRTQMDYLLAVTGVDRMIRNGAIAEETVFQGTDAMLLEAQLQDELSDRLTPRVAKGILDGIRQSLSIHLETVPFSLSPPGKRGEQMATVQELRPDPTHRPGPISGPKLVARTILGRAIWYPSLIPFLVPKEWIGNLLEARAHLSFSQVDFRIEQGSFSLAPTPWGRQDLVNPVVHPLVSLPMSEIGFPPEPAKLLEATGHYPEGSQARNALNLMGEHPEKQDWFSLVDFLEAPSP